MTVSPHDRIVRIEADVAASPAVPAGFASHPLVGRNGGPLRMLDDDGPAPAPGDPGTVILTCASCGAEMIERKCKLICRCGYFLSCSDYY